MNRAYFIPVFSILNILRVSKKYSNNAYKVTSNSLSFNVLLRRNR